MEMQMFPESCKSKLPEFAIKRIRYYATFFGGVNSDKYTKKLGVWKAWAHKHKPLMLKQVLELEAMQKIDVDLFPSREELDSMRWKSMQFYAYFDNWESPEDDQ